MSYLIEQIIDGLIDSGDRDFQRFYMESFSIKIRKSVVLEQDYRDISGIVMQTRTSQCTVIKSSNPSYSNSSKSRAIRKENYRTYSDYARREYSEILNSNTRSELRCSMQRIYEMFMDCRTSSDYLTCDDLLSSIDIESCEPSVLLSLVIASYPISSRLSKRSIFFYKVMHRFRFLYGLSETIKMLERLR